MEALSARRCAATALLQQHCCNSTATALLQQQEMLQHAESL
jgi:hypothetical protein